jgi:hypothetical protein
MGISKIRNKESAKFGYFKTFKEWTIFMKELVNLFQFCLGFFILKLFVRLVEGVRVLENENHWLYRYITNLITNKKTNIASKNHPTLVQIHFHVIKI